MYIGKWILTYRKSKFRVERRQNDFILMLIVRITHLKIMKNASGVKKIINIANIE